MDTTADPNARPDADAPPGRARDRAAETPRYHLSLPREYAEPLQELAARTRRALGAAVQVAIDAALRAENIPVPSPPRRNRAGRPKRKPARAEA